MSATSFRYGPLISVAGQADARAAIFREPAALVRVHRDVDRALVFKCPSGCGDVLSINLDSRAGPAWQLRITKRGVTLMPSVWRTHGCGAHFVLWNSTVWWCRFEDDYEWPDEMERELRDEWKRIRAEWRQDNRQK